MARVVTVTGASGYIGTEITKQLLEKGYRVRATVRDKSVTAKVGHLKALGDVLPGTLELWEADLLHDGAFDEVVKGSHFVFHTASPFVLTNITDPHKQLVEPAVKGTENVMGAVIRANASVKRVVLTSSVAAMRSTRFPAPPMNSLHGQHDWNEQDTVEVAPYPVSKKLAEKAAWKLAKENGLDLVTINPIFVFGPVVAKRKEATSIAMVIAYLEGNADALKSATMPQTAALRYSNVHDVARAHVRAAEIPAARGRYLVGHRSSVSTTEISEALQARFPEYDIPAGKPGVPEELYDVAKAENELGIRCRPVAETFVDMAVTLIELGMAKPKRSSNGVCNGF